MSNENSTTAKKSKDKKIHPAVGMWKDKWPNSKSSKEVAKELRRKQWQRS